MPSFYLFIKGWVSNATLYCIHKFTWPTSGQHSSNQTFITMFYCVGGTNTSVTIEGRQHDIDVNTATGWSSAACSWSHFIYPFVSKNSNNSNDNCCFHSHLTLLYKQFLGMPGRWVQSLSWCMLSRVRLELSRAASTYQTIDIITASNIPSFY